MVSQFDCISNLIGCIDDLGYRIDDWIDEYLDYWMNGCIPRLSNEWMDGCIPKLSNEWTIVWMPILLDW